ncbi:MAG TPA: hypothetical protein VHJ37_05515 [Thermoleophilaceae bacterium]|jgi:hypothetical protein|nr:hypothetical protein [Thermoleophilaceae bacterium]
MSRWEVKGGAEKARRASAYQELFGVAGRLLARRPRRRALVTIAVSVKVMDGVVLAADSASTIASAGAVENVYNNANKVFNLRKGLPVGLITFSPRAPSRSSLGGSEKPKTAARSTRAAPRL